MPIGWSSSFGVRGIEGTIQFWLQSLENMKKKGKKKKKEAS